MAWPSAHLTVGPALGIVLDQISSKQELLGRMSVRRKTEHCFARYSLNEKSLCLDSFRKTRSTNKQLKQESESASPPWEQPLRCTLTTKQPLDPVNCSRRSVSHMHRTGVGWWGQAVYVQSRAAPLHDSRGHHSECMLQGEWQPPQCTLQNMMLIVPLGLYSWEALSL